MKRKILSFITDGKKFLALRNHPHPDHGGDFWFVVTGEVENNESFEDAVKREIKEETGLDSERIFSLNWGSIYSWKGDVCKELNFFAFVKKEKIVLNEEHINSEWLGLDEFVERIKWEDDKGILKQVLKKAIKGELYFKEKTVKDYRI